MPRLSNKFTFTDAAIVKVYFWSNAHDRPQGWACYREHVGGIFRPRRLPSESQLSRRLQTLRIQKLIEAVHRALAGTTAGDEQLLVDAKPLPVSEQTRDPDARTGRVHGGFGKGYRLHAVAKQDRRIASWSLQPLNVHEAKVAPHLIHELDAMGPRTLFMGDGQYDSAPLYQQVKDKGGRMLTRPRGLGQHHDTLVRMGEARREMVAVWNTTPYFASSILKDRIRIEGIFSQLCGRGGGLGPLPNWVRRITRVRRWVGVKIILHNAYLLNKMKQERAG